MTLPIDDNGSFFTEQDLANLSTGKANGKRRKNPAPNILYGQNNSPETAANDNNQAFLTPERFEQLMHHGSRNILLSNGFDLKYLGSGEGGQAYGYGIYLGEAFGTGEAYRTAGMSENETSPAVITAKNGKSYTPYEYGQFIEQQLPDIEWDNVEHILSPAHKHNYSASWFASTLADVVNGRFNSFNSIHEAVNFYLSTYSKDFDASLMQNIVEHSTPVSVSRNPNYRKGNHYLVDGPENNSLLDWDAPMTAQPQKILDALKRGGLCFNDDETGEQLYRRLQLQFGCGKNGERLASQKLNELGIPGHRFWDAGSRKKQSGTHNFVIWNTDTLTFSGLTDDSQQDAHEYFHAEDYYNAHLDSLDNDSDIRGYSNSDYDYDMAHIDDIADAQLDAKDNNGFAETYSQAINADDFLTPEAKRQADAIRAKYQGTSQWLKAPNGQNTKLSESQWLLVRTDNFKAWFGDWEHDRKNSSKIIDTNGEPLVVYHSTDKNKRLKIFKTSPNGSHFGTLNSALDRLGHRNGFGRYGRLDEHFNPDDYGKIIPCFLNIRNPLFTSDNGEWHEALRSAVSRGYDGIIYENAVEDKGSYSFAIPKPNQIKSASRNNGDFSTTNSEIYKQAAKLQRNPFV